MLGVFLAGLLLAVSSFLILEEPSADDYFAAVQGSGMEPTIRDGDVVTVQPGVVPKRFDIVHFRFPGDPAREFVGRIVGLPFSTIEFADGVLLVNRSASDDVVDVIPGYSMDEVVLRSGEYFILGDNRNNSSDSRSFGSVHLGDILGVVQE